MKLRKVFVTGAAAALFVSSTLHVSAAEVISGNYVKALKENQKFIIDVEAYKAAYSDLEQTFGDDLDAYVEHYLTIGVYEGRSKGVLFDPLVYAESYSDVKDAFGYNIQAIVNHYLTFGVAEKRTMGTAGGYSDIAAAERAGVYKAQVQRNLAATSSYENDTISGGVEAVTVENTAADRSTGNTGSTAVVSNGNALNNALPSNNVATANGNTSGTNTTAPTINHTTADKSAAPAGNQAVKDDNSSPVVNNTTAGNSNVPAVNDGASGSNSNAAPVNNDDASSGGNNTSSDKGYHHTTSIYDNDESTLLRVEYYDDNNKLIQYSSVSNFDSNTNSYTEEIYHYDKETESSVLDRTDTYVNGVLSSSENH